MSPRTAPKAVLFDIGGVCVTSPFQAIIDYEKKNSIPSDWVNFAISRSAPNGAWQSLERGEIKMDEAFFRAFNDDLSNKTLWHEFHTSSNKDNGKLKDVFLKNPSMLGDHVSLKAEKEDSEPTDQDGGAKGDVGAHKKPDVHEEEASRPGGKEKLRDAAMENPSLLGNPVSLEVEQANSEPTAQDLPPEDPAPTMTSVSSLEQSPTREQPSSPRLPALPKIDGKALFWSMMDAARSPDPYIFPALLRLKSLPSEKRPIRGALSNTVIFPPGHPYNRIASVPASLESTPSAPTASPASHSFVSSDTDPRSHFDVFVASSETGLRKPDRKIYELTIRKLDEYSKRNGGTGIEAKDVVFLDDIGENLKTAREMGMHTIKVQLGKTWRAVKELEGVIGNELMDDKTRRSKL